MLADPRVRSVAASTVATVKEPRGGFSLPQIAKGGSTVASLGSSSKASLPAKRSKSTEPPRFSAYEKGGARPQPKGSSSAQGSGCSVLTHVAASLASLAVSSFQKTVASTVLHSPWCESRPALVADAGKGRTRSTRGSISAWATTCRPLPRTLPPRITSGEHRAAGEPG